MSSAATWIKSSMLGSPAQSPKRVMSEAEMRVQKALQKLDIPEWYLNKHSKAPKILKNDTPIDYREPSWKQGVKKQIIPHQSKYFEINADSTRVYGSNMAKVNESSGVYVTPQLIDDSVTENECSTYRTPIVQLSVNNNIKSTNVNGYEQESEKSEKPSFGNKSYTFPMISPSKKVQNINIVLGSPADQPTDSLEKTWNSDINSNNNSEINRMSQIFENSSGSDRYKTATRDSSGFNSSLISPRPFYKKVGTPCITPVSGFQVRAVSTPDTVLRPLFTSTLEKPTPCRQKYTAYQKETFGLNQSSNSISNDSVLSSVSNVATNGSFLEKDNKDWMDSTYYIGEVKPIGMDREKACKDCGSKVPRVHAAVTKTKKLPNHLKNGKNIKVPVLEQQPGKGEESETDSESGREEITISDSVNDGELNSAASLTSIPTSYKGSEIGSGPVPATSTLKSCFSKTVKKQEPKSNSNRNDNVHWIPVEPIYFKRANSLINIMSQRGLSLSRASPSASPVSGVNDANGVHDKAYYREIEQKYIQSIRKLLRIDERGILDSGYSDRSQKCDSLASSRTWFEDSISSESELENTFSLKGRRINRVKS